MLAYIWNEHHKFPHEVYNLQPWEKEMVYQFTQAQIKAKKDAMKGKGGK